MNPFILGFTDGDQWRPGIGDPTVMGWVTVAAYCFGALFCALAARHQTARPQILFFRILAGSLFLLGINKQLDLQTWFTLFFRQMAVDGGWYEQRRILQLLFIVCLILAGAIAGVLLVWHTRHHLRENRVALAGICFLAVFILIRAASFHHVDQLLGARLAGLKMNGILELTGIALTSYPALTKSLIFNGKTGFLKPSAT